MIGPTLPARRSTMTERSHVPSRRLGPRSAGLLAFLVRTPRGLLVAGLVLVLLTGLFAPGLVGGAVLLLVAGLVGWLAWLSWPAAQLPARVGRLMLVAALVAVAVAKLL
ncbi:MAG TPA: DUF6703 family protein [Cryptosporangiaceae bacterium]|nr:DUF6703 family protein [Cryptosporangiaceae bacterium]